jgi:hypothetical protein
MAGGPSFGQLLEDHHLNLTTTGRLSSVQWLKCHLDNYWKTIIWTPTGCSSSELENYWRTIIWTRQLMEENHPDNYWKTVIWTMTEISSFGQLLDDRHLENY